MTAGERRLREWASTGELDRRLKALHRRWRAVLAADDFVQEVVLRAWRRREGFRGETAGEFAEFLAAIGHSVAVDAWRRRERQTQAETAYAVARQQRETAPASATVEWLAAELSERERDLFHRKYTLGQSAAEIAAAHGSTVAAVHQLHYRALQKLRESRNRPDS